MRSWFSRVLLPFTCSSQAIQDPVKDRSRFPVSQQILKRRIEFRAEAFIVKIHSKHVNREARPYTVVLPWCTRIDTASTVSLVGI